MLSPEHVVIPTLEPNINLLSYVNLEKFFLITINYFIKKTLINYIQF